MAAAGSSSASGVEVRSCPNCLAAGAWSGNRCVYCGTRFVCRHCRTAFTASEIQHAQACPTCGTRRELPRVQAPLALQGAATHDAPPGDLLDTVRAVLAAAEPVHGTSVREARVMLARALLEAGRAKEAAAELESALHDEGPVPVVRLLLERAAALLQAGDDVAGTRALLTAVQRDPVQHRQLIVETAETLKPATAAVLDRWLIGTCVPTIMRATGDDHDGLGGAVHLLVAANHAGNGRYDEALERVREASLVDRAETCRYLDRLASPTASVGFPGGEVALATFRARAFAGIGEEDRAVALAGTVIDNALTGEGHPEAAAYEIRGRAAGRDPTSRAADLLEAGRLVGTRRQQADLHRSVALLEEAAAVDATNPEIYWYWADNLRLSAYESSPPDSDVLHRALDVWERGRALRRVGQSWPYIVEAALAEALGEAEPESRRSWAVRALRAVVDGVNRDPEASFNWAWLSRCCRRLDLWATASFAMRWCETAAGGFTSHDDAELEERVSLRNQIDPDGLASALDEYEEIVGPSPWSRQIRAVALLRDHDYTTAIDVVSDAVDEDFSAPVRLIQAYVLAMADDPRLLEVAADLQPGNLEPIEAAALGALDPGWLALWRGDVSAADQLLSEVLDASGGASLDPFETASYRLQLALLKGGVDPMPHLDDALRRITSGALLELDTELDWVSRVLLRQHRREDAGLVDQCRMRIAAKAEALPSWAAGDTEDALAELDGELIADESRPGEHQALSAVRGLVSRFVGIPVTTESEWPSVLRIDLGAALIPLDADERWQEWSLFTDLIPRCRDELRARLGFPAMGIAIGASYLGEHQYEVQVNGVSDGVHEVPDDLVPDEAQPMDHYPGTAPWEPAIERLAAAVLRQPNAVFVPRTIESLLEEWRDRGEETADAVAQLEDDLRLRIAVWQRLHSIVSRDGRLPEWDDGLRDLLTSVIGSGGVDG